MKSLKTRKDYISRATAKMRVLNLNSAKGVAAYMLYSAVVERNTIFIINSLMT